MGGESRNPGISVDLYTVPDFQIPKVRESK